MYDNGNPILKPLETIMILESGSPGAGKTYNGILFLVEQIKQKNFENYFYLNLRLTEKFLKQYPNVHSLNFIKTASLNEYSSKELRVYENQPFFNEYQKLLEEYDSKTTNKWSKENQRDYSELNRIFPVEIPKDGSEMNVRRWLPDKSLVIIDECQDFFPAKRRHISSEAPLFLQFLSIHRHFGLEFFLITQDPRKVDIEIRNNISQYVYVEKFFGSRISKLKFFNSFNNNAAKAQPDKKKFVRIKKNIHTLFNSTLVGEHEQAKVLKFPLITTIAPVILLGFGFLTFYYMFHEFDQLGEKKDEKRDEKPNKKEETGQVKAKLATDTKEVQVNIPPNIIYLGYIRIGYKHKVLLYAIEKNEENIVCRRIEPRQINNLKAHSVSREGIELEFIDGKRTFLTKEKSVEASNCE